MINKELNILKNYQDKKQNKLYKYIKTTKQQKNYKNK